MRRAVLIGAVLMSSWVLTAPAQAQRLSSRPDCTANRFDYDLIADRVTFRVGDMINFTVEIDNLGAGACDVGSLVLLQLPGPGRHGERPDHPPCRTRHG